MYIYSMLIKNLSHDNGVKEFDSTTILAKFGQLHEDLELVACLDSHLLSLDVNHECNE